MLTFTIICKKTIIKKWRKRNIFQGAKSIFTIFSRYKLSILVDPTQNSVVSESDKKKIFNLKKSSAHFHTFPPSIFNFPPLPFQIFLLFLSTFPFFLAPIFPVGEQKFPCEKYQGTLRKPPGPYLVRH